MQETAVFAYVTAVFIAIATVVFSFINIYENHSPNAAGMFIIGAGMVGILWAMAHWIEQKNT